MKISEDNQAKTFGDWAYIAIAKHFQKILKHEPEVLKDKDSEELHQMRVGMRRLRSTITGFAPALDLSESLGEKKVGKIAKILGELRDIDVLLEHLQSQYQPALPEAEEQILSLALNGLKNRRKSVFKKVEDTIHSKNYRKLKKGFKNWLKNPSYSVTGLLQIEQVLPDLLLPQISKLLLHPGWLVTIQLQGGKITFEKKMDENKVESFLEKEGIILHELRKEAKRTRYNMELFTRFFNGMYADYVQDIKAIQTVLGDLQDCFVLVEFLTDSLDAYFPEKMPIMAAKIRKIRWEKWQKWTQLQSKFLQVDIKKELRLVVSNCTKS